MAVGHHVMFRLASDRVIAPTEGELERAGRALAGVGARCEVLCWNLADTHGHVLVLGDRERAGKVARRLLVALQLTLRPGEAFQPARIKPMADHSHLVNAFWYVLRQADHHGVSVDPWQLGSCLPALVGLRLPVPGLRGRVGRHLPRVTDEALERALGWSGHVPGTLGEVAWEREHLPAAAAGAVGRAALSGRGEAMVGARRAAVALGLRVAGPGRTAALLGLSRSSVHRLATGPDADADLVTAARRQWAWRVEVAGARVG